MKNFTSALIITFTITIFSSSSRGAWGDYDTTFGFLGASIDGVTNHYPQGVGIQSDGKILVTGYRLVGGKQRFFLRRYLSDGQLDTSFGNNGAAIWNSLINVDYDYAGHRIVVQSNGRIAVAGLGNQRPTIWRFLSTGSPDTSMGSGGMKTLSAYATSSLPPGIATYANILYIGLLEQGNASTSIIKLNSSASQDMSFGTNGEALTDAGNIFSMAVDPTSGNILIAGRRRSDPNDYGVERFLTSGVLDASFTHWGAAYGGWVGSNPSEFVRLANGQFVMNERWVNVGQGALLIGANIVRLSSNGAFTSRSVYEPQELVNFGEPLDDNCPDITAQQGDGRVILKGSGSDNLFRFSTTFSTIQTMSCPNNQSLGSRTPAVLQSDDKMVVAGRYNGYIAIVRTLP